MELITDYIEPAELTGFVRADLEQFHLKEDRNFLLPWFPITEIDDVEYDFSTGGDTEANVVRFRAYGAESPLGDRPGFGSSRATLPPLSEKIPLTEYENLRRRSSPDQAIRNVAERDAARQGRGIARRLELARGEALRTGKVTIAENGLVTEIDFDRDPAHTTTAGTAWGTSASADPIANLLAWQALLEAKGYVMGTILAERPVVRAAVRCARVINAVRGSAAAATQVSVTELNALLESEGLPPMTVVTANVGGATTIGAKHIIAMPAEPIGATVFGTTAEALEDAYDLDLDNGEAPGVVSGQYKSNDPVTLWTKTAAVAAPALAMPNATLAAQVLA